MGATARKAALRLTPRKGGATMGLSSPNFQCGERERYEKRADDDQGLSRDGHWSSWSDSTYSPASTS